MTQIAVGVEKGKQPQGDDAQLIINSPYVIQPHLQKKKPSALLLFVAILLTLCVIVTTILGIVWLVRSHIWLNNIQYPPTSPTPSDDHHHHMGVAGVESINDGPHIMNAMTFDEIWTVRPKSFSGQWMREPDTNKLLYRDGYGNLVVEDFNTTEITQLVPNTTFEEHGITRYYPNYDGRYILMIYDEVKVWRHSYRAFALIYDTETQETIEFPNQANLRTNRLQYVNWAPLDNSLRFVQGNNIYIQSDPDAAPVQLTDDGDELLIFNGIPDWVYEEDVLGTSAASYMSDNGDFLIFGKFDDRNVGLVEYPLYLPTSDVYSQQYKAAYPMAGAIEADGTAGNNTIATLHLVDTRQTSMGVVTIPVPAELAGADHYFTRVAFVDDATVAITWVNRTQNDAIIQICSLISNSNAPPTPDCNNNFNQTVADGWIDAPWPAPIADLVENNIGYYTYLMNEETQGNYKHIARITIPETGLGEATFITSGEHEVQGVLALDEAADLLYFYSTNGVQRNRHLMRMNPDQPNSTLCITCQLDGCEYASASFSPNADYFMLSCLGPDVPRYEIWNSTLDLQRTLEDNQEFIDLIATKDLPTREFMNISLGNGLYGSAEVYRPPDVEQDSMHPLLVYVYAGPGSLQVTSRFGYGSTISNWLRYLGSAHNIAVASVDARGTVGLGEDWKFQMYRRLATIEVDDQIAFGNALKRELIEYVNPSEAAVFGWSYGGFITSHVLGKANDTTYQCGVAVAPVTSKKYYDTAYTERYMGLAVDNMAGYDATDMFPLAPNFRDKQYMIAHGTHDDNVHFRHFTTFVEALARAEVQFRQQVYVDEDHSINTPAQSRHLFRAMTDFLNNDCYTTGYQPPTLPPATTPSGAATVRSSFLFLAVALLVAMFSAL